MLDCGCRVSCSQAWDNLGASKTLPKPSENTCMHSSMLCSCNTWTMTLTHLASGALWGTKSIIFMISTTRLLPASLRFCVTFSHFLLIEANSPIPVLVTENHYIPSSFHPSWGCSHCRRLSVHHLRISGGSQMRCCTNIQFSFLSDFHSFSCSQSSSTPDFSSSSSAWLCSDCSAQTFSWNSF